MMKMIDMKMPKKKGKDNMMVSAPGGMKDEYPYGLRISLGNDELAKLSDIAGLQVGDEVMITACGKVTQRSENDQQGGKPDRRMEIQITSMCAENENDEKAYVDEKTPTDKRIAMSQKRKGM